MTKDDKNPYQDDPILAHPIASINFTEGWADKKKGLALNTRIHTALANEGIVFVGDLIKLIVAQNGSHLKHRPQDNKGPSVKVPGIGYECVSVIKDKMSDMGLALATPKQQSSDTNERQDQSMDGYAKDDFKLVSSTCDDQGLHLEISIPRQFANLIKDGHVFLKQDDVPQGEKADYQDIKDCTNADKIEARSLSMILTYPHRPDGESSASDHDIVTCFKDAVNTIKPRAEYRAIRALSTRYGISGKVPKA